MAVALVTLVAPGLAQAELAPFGHACQLQYGVRFCPTETLEQRVPSFDKVPLDVDVTLPPTGNGPFPTIVALHGWGEGNSKKNYEATTPEAEGGLGYHNNNIYYAEHGYALVTYSARGWDNSCGTEESRKSTPACEKGWTHLADERYEARDTQHLLGLLVDEQIAKAGALGVTGFSYGAGQTVELAYLKNRIRLPNGEFAPWTSPKGKPLSIKAAFALAPWADLVSALMPNGRFNSGEVPPFGQSYEPIGVELLSYVNGLYALANTGAGYLAPPGEDPEADLTGWNALIGAGEPYETPEDEAIAHQIYTYHGALGIPLSGKPAPTLLASGWTDGLFPVEQSQRIYDQVRAVKGYVAVMLGDAGHPPADNKTNTFRALAEAGGPFFAAKLKHEGTTLNNGSVTAYTQTCPLSAPGGGPFIASRWSKLSTHTLTFGSSEPQIFTSAGGDSAIAAEFDPVVEFEESEKACHTTKAVTEPNTANYTMVSPGFTLLGRPTITATIKTTGLYGEIAARLWDVLSNGEQRLISRGVYRLTENQTGAITFELHGNGYEYAKGDTVKLQLLGRDAPAYRASNGTFAVEATKVTVALPTT